MYFTIASVAAILAFTASAAPAPAIDYTSGVDFTKITYPPGTGANLPSYNSYPPSPGGCPAGTGSTTTPPACPAPVGSPFTFTSTYHVVALGAAVVNANSQPAPGPATARGTFDYSISSFTNTICYNISLYNVVGAYQSPALTATHIHEAAVGRNGPPRIAFPNPVGNDVYRNSVGCLKGPFKTGINVAGTTTDTGSGFTVKQIEANPAGFFTDSHTALFSAGVVRGQLA